MSWEHSGTCLLFSWFAIFGRAEDQKGDLRYKAVLKFKRVFPSTLYDIGGGHPEQAIT